MKVLIAVDGSAESTLAVRFFADLPWRTTPAAVVLTALMNPYYDTIASETDYQFGELEREAAEKNFESAKDILDAKGIPSQHEIAIGHPSRLIMDYAERDDVDLIVLGAQGHSAVFRVMLGSNADYVANHAKCPVLVVRPRIGGVEFNSVKHPYRLLVAYDATERSKLAVEQMASFDWPSDTTIHLSRMLERPPMLPDEVVYDVQALDNATNELARVAKELPCKCNVMHSVREAIHVGSSFLMPEEIRETDLLFLGNTGKSAISRFLLGSTSRYLLHHAPCSLWIARDKAWKH